jgi:hypothetical protein
MASLKENPLYLHETLRTLSVLYTYMKLSELFLFRDVDVEIEERALLEEVGGRYSSRGHGATRPCIFIIIINNLFSKK